MLLLDRQLLLKDYVDLLSSEWSDSLALLSLTLQLDRSEELWRGVHG